MIPISRISARDIPALPALVPEHLDRNPWILYHATTGALSEVIEREGFVARDDTVFSDAIRRLLTIYHSIGWHGVSTSGYAVLRGFSFLRNHTSQERPIYFTTYGHRSPIYARPDFAGGETARAIRHAYRDLLRYVNESALRAQHLADKRRECIDLVKKDGLPIRVIVPNLDWVTAKLNEVAPLYQRLDALEKSGQPGVIYAVEFTADDIPHLAFRQATGAAMFRAVPASRIRHKVEIADASEISARCDAHLAMREMWREKDVAGLIARIAEQGGKELAQADWENGQRALASLFDPAGGTDEGYDLAAQHGTPAVRSWLAQQREARQPE